MEKMQGELLVPRLVVKLCGCMRRALKVPGSAWGRGSTTRELGVEVLGSHRVPKPGFAGRSAPYPQHRGLHVLEMLGCAGTAGTVWAAGGPTGQWDLSTTHTPLPTCPLTPSILPKIQQRSQRPEGCQPSKNKAAGTEQNHGAINTAIKSTSGGDTVHFLQTPSLHPRAPAPQRGRVLEPGCTEHLLPHLRATSGHTWPRHGLLFLQPLPPFAVSRCCCCRGWFFMAGGADLDSESESLRGKWDPITEILFPCPVFFANEILQNLSVLVCWFFFFSLPAKSLFPVPFKWLRIGCCREAMHGEGMNIYHGPRWVGELINVPAINPAAPAGTLNQLVNAKWLRTQGWGERPSPRCAIYLSAFDDSQRRFEKE